MGLTGVFAGGNVTVQVGQVGAEGPSQVLFQSLLAEHQLFAGREQELDRLDGFLDSGGYFFVSAPSGFGKTALLVNWVRALVAKGENLAYAFINRLAGHAGEDVILGALSQQLAAIHGEGGSLPTRTSELRALYVRLLTTAPAAGQRVTVVLDGLDEATGWEARPDLFPPELPEGVAIVFSAREIAETDWLSTLALDDRPVATLRLTSLGPAEISRILAATGEALPAWASDSQVVDEMYAVSNGDPFYVRYLVADLIPDKEGRIRISSLGELRQQPSGLDGYFENWWAELREARQSPELGRATRDVLGYLLVAKAPLSRSELSDLGDEDALDDWTVDDALALIRPHTTGNDDAGFALAHPRFQSYLAENRIREPQQRAFRDQLLAYCARWSEHEGPYALRHYAEHLADAERSEELFALARDDAFAEVQLRVLPFEPTLSIRVTELALATAAELDDAPAMAEFAIRKAWKLESVRGAESPLQALQAAGLDSAWALADLHEPEPRTVWHLLLAWKLKDDGRTDESRATLERLSRTQPKLPDDLMVIFQTLREIDADLVVALEASALPTYVRGQAAFEEAIDQVQAGAFAPAYGTAGTIVNETLRDDAYRELALAQIRAADFTAAQASAERVEDAYRRVATLREVAAAQAQANQSEQAEATFAAAEAATGAIEDNWRSVALSELAAAQGQAGDVEAARANFAGAQAAAETIDEGLWRARALIALAVARSQAGDAEEARESFAHAREAAETIEDDYTWYRDMALSELADALAQTGDLTAATAMVEELEDQRRPGAYGHLVFALTKAGDLAQAQSMVETLDGQQLARVVGELAAAQMRSGDAAAAKANLIAALEAAAKIDDEEKRMEAYGDLALAQAEGGDRAVAEMIEDGYWRTRALLEVAEAQVKTGDGEATATIAAAHATAVTIEDANDRALACREVALAQRQAGDHKGAHESLAAAQAATAAIEDESVRVTALMGLAAAYAQAGDAESARASFAAALVPAGTVDDDRWASQAYKELAVAQAQGGDFAAAEATPETIEDDEWRGDVLSAVAVAQAQDGDVAAARASSAAAQAAYQTLSDDEERAAALSRLAVSHMESGDLDGAVDIIDSIELTNYWAGTLRALALAQAEAGYAEAARANFAAAQATAEAIEDRHERAWQLAWLGAAQAQAGDMESGRANFASAQAAAETIDMGVYTGLWRARAFSTLASAQTQAGDGEAARANFAAAQEAAEGIEDPEWRARALTELAPARSQGGDAESASATFEAAREAAEAIESVYFRVSALTKLAVARLQEGDDEAAQAGFAEARAISEDVADHWDRGAATRALAEAQAQAGFAAAALKTVEALADHREALEMIADSLAENVDRADLKLVVGACAAYRELTPVIIALLARAYPEQRLELVARVQPLLA